MPDLEQRLRTDAAREQVVSVPELSAALDAALRRRAPATAWMAAAVVVALLAAVAAVVVVRRSDGDRPASVPSLSDAPAHRDGETLHHLDDYGVDRVTRVPGDARALDVLVPYSTAPGECSVFRPEVTIAEQSASQVRLVLSGYVYTRPDPKSGQYNGFSCTLGGTRSVTVHLDDPLGSRAVYGDRAAKERTQVVPVAPVVRPTRVPTGFRVVDVVHTAPPSGYPGSRVTYQRNDMVLVVSAGRSEDLPIIQAPLQGTPSINGAGGRLYVESEQTCVAWDAGADSSRLVCATGSPRLSTQEVIEVARSAR